MDREATFCGADRLALRAEMAGSGVSSPIRRPSISSRVRKKTSSPRPTSSPARSANSRISQRSRTYSERASSRSRARCALSSMRRASASAFGGNVTGNAPTRRRTPPVAVPAAPRHPPATRANWPALDQASRDPRRDEEQRARIRVGPGGRRLGDRPPVAFLRLRHLRQTDHRSQAGQPTASAHVRDEDSGVIGSDQIGQFPAQPHGVVWPSAWQCPAHTKPPA